MNKAKELQAIEAALLKLSNKLQSDYYDKVWRSISPQMKAGSIFLIAQNPIFVKAWKEVVGTGINKFLKDELNKIEASTATYYSQFNAPILPFAQIKSMVADGMKRNLANFANQYNISLTVANSTRQFAISQIAQGKSFAEVRDETESFIVGTNQKLGVVDNFNLVQNRVQDTFAENDRRISNEYANELQLNYFIYQGGEIKTTRTFCEERNGGVYTREEGEAWNSLQWDGMKEGNNIFVDGGGYNCRHYLDWISYELAKQLRPSIERSIYDTP
jgi:hypothetical protein